MLEPSSAALRRTPPAPSAYVQHKTAFNKKQKNAYDKIKTLDRGNEQPPIKARCRSPNTRGGTRLLRLPGSGRKRLTRRSDSRTVAAQPFTFTRGIEYEH